MAKTKRKRNVDLVFCDKCNSTLVIGSATNTNADIRELAEQHRQFNRHGFWTGPSLINRSPPPSPAVQIAKPVLLIGTPQPVKKLPVTKVPEWPISTDYKLKLYCCACKQEKLVGMTDPSFMKDVIANMYQKVKSPQTIELQFKGFKFSKQKYAKSQVIAVGCVDRNGLPYQFKGESSVKILYGAVKNRWFTTRVCWQKFWSKGKGDLGWRTPLFIQRPKIVDKDVTLI